MKWLTPEEAITAANLTTTATKLDALAKPLGTRIAKSTNGKNTAEKRFHAAILRMRTILNFCLTGTAG